MSFDAELAREREERDRSHSIERDTFDFDVAAQEASDLVGSLRLEELEDLITGMPTEELALAATIANALFRAHPRPTDVRYKVVNEEGLVSRTRGFDHIFSEAEFRGAVEGIITVFKIMNVFKH